MRIPESFIEEVVLRNPLEEIVAHYATLKRAGSNMVCCCPFHHEKTPSFTLYANPSHYYCYGCGAGGDVITFVRQMENLDYVAAVEYLANRAGLTMPVTSHDQVRVNKKRFYELNAEAARFWHNNLFSPEGKVGLDYLTGRGLSLPVIRRFGLGYAGNSRDALCRHLLQAGYRKNEIKEAFLGGIGKNDRPYDYFRDRAIFPIIDPAGNVLAFSGRQVSPIKEGDRKYFNTNDTPVYKKSRNIFALNIAKNAPEKELILCEGNMDAVSLHAHGISRAVASLGTALTSEQCRLLARYTERILLCYDADEAGRRAAKKAIRLLQEAGIRVRVMTLTGKDSSGRDLKDPDDYIRALGKGAFDALAAEAPGAIEYLFRDLTSRHEIDTMDGKNALIQEGITFLANVPSPIEQALYIHRLAEVTGIPEAVIRAGCEKKTVSVYRKEQKEALDRELKKTRGLANPVNPDKAKFLASAAKEENILGILLIRSEYLNTASVREKLSADLFQCEFCRRVLSLLLEATENGESLSFSVLNEALTPEEIGELEGMKKKREALGNNTTDVLTELIARLGEEKARLAIKNEPLSDDWLRRLKEKKS